MTNIERILEVFDRHLRHKVELILYGRAAIYLGFEQVPAAVKQTMDVDAIIPLPRLPSFEADTAFWEAQERTNRELEQDGLYVTHLFASDQVFLRADWERQVVRLSRPPTRWLQLYRPATLDLILTKMMRGDDPQDLEDIAFMIRHDQITLPELEAAFSDAVIPDVIELQKAFEIAKPLVRDLAK